MKIARLAPGLSRSFFLSATYFGLAGACASDDLPSSNLGNTADQPAGTDDASAQRVSVVTEDGAVDPYLIGDWVGHAEDLFHPSNADGRRPTYVFPSGSSEIYLHVDIRGGFPYGKLRFGARQAPPPQTGVAYGSGINYFYAELADNEQPVPPVEGFAYNLQESVLRFGSAGGQGGRYSAIALGYAESQAFGEWCPLQPSLPQGDDLFNCVGATSYSGGDPALGTPCAVTLLDGSQRDIDCNLVALCAYMACRCTEHGCAERGDGPTHDLWLGREGDQLLGYLSGAAFEYGEVGHFMPIGAIRFDREEP